MNFMLDLSWLVFMWSGIIALYFLNVPLYGQLNFNLFNFKNHD